MGFKLPADLGTGHLAELSRQAIAAVNKTQSALADALKAKVPGANPGDPEIDNPNKLDMTNLEDVMAYNTLNILATSTVSFGNKAIGAEEKKLESANR